MHQFKVMKIWFFCGLAGTSWRVNGLACDSVEKEQKRLIKVNTEPVLSSKKNGFHNPMERFKRYTKGFDLEESALLRELIEDDDDNFGMGDDLEKVEIIEDPELRDGLEVIATEDDSESSVEEPDLVGDDGEGVTLLNDISETEDAIEEDSTVQRQLQEDNPDEDIADRMDLGDFMESSIVEDAEELARMKEVEEAARWLEQSRVMTTGLPGVDEGEDEEDPEKILREHREARPEEVVEDWEATMPKIQLEEEEEDEFEWEEPAKDDQTPSPEIYGQGWDPKELTRIEPSAYKEKFTEKALRKIKGFKSTMDKMAKMRYAPYVFTGMTVPSIALLKPA